MGRRRVGLGADHVARPRLERHRRVVARVAAEVEHGARRRRPDRTRHELALGRALRLLVRVVRGVGGPVRAQGGGPEPPGPSPEPGEQAAQGRLRQGAAGGGGPGVDAAAPSRGLEPGRKDDVEERLRPELVAKAQEPHELGRREALDPAPIRRVVRHAEPRREQQRAQELVAELAVAVPVGARDVALDRQHVDEDRLGAAELDVVGGGVGEAEAVLQQREVQVELQQGGRAQRRERPLVGIGHERDALVLQEERGALDPERGRIVRRDPRADQLAAAHQPREDRRAEELALDLGGRGRDPAEDPVARGEDVAPAIPVRARHPLRRRGLAVHGAPWYAPRGARPTA